MKTFVSAFLMLVVCSTVTTTRAAFLPGNFWPNSTFEEGQNLDDPIAGRLTGWNRGGGNPAICQISRASVSASHGLAVVDDDNNFGEWYSDVAIAGRVAVGEKIDLRWHEVYQILGGEMRVTVVFLNSGGSLTGVKHFVVRGSSEGFQTTVEDSPFVERNESADVPEGTATIRVSLVSGGTLEQRGNYVIDDLSVARHPAPILLPNNFWTNNPTFELGENLDMPTGTLTQWNRGGNRPAICQVSSANSISPTHALAVVDTDNGFGEWYSDLALAGVARAGDELNFQWFEMFNVSAGGEMRVTVLFLNASGGVVDAKHFVARGQSAGWAGSAAASPFVQRKEKLTVPAGAATLRASLVSGGSLETTGVMLIDDFSANKSTPPSPDLLVGNLWPNPIFEEGENLDDPTGTPAGWSRGGNAPQVCIVSREKARSDTHSLGIVDDSADGFGEWSSNFRLGAATAGGKLLNLQWFELYSITNGEMRTSVAFFDATNQLLAQNHFVVRDRSDGWRTNVAGSAFTRRNEQVAVPPGARRMQVALVSGGSAATVGLMLIDNFSMAPETNAPVALFGNFLGNVGFEVGTNLGNPNLGRPAGWERGGGDLTIGKLLTDAYVSSTHALAVVDNNPAGFGEWYQSLDLAGKVAGGDDIDVQWWEMFNVSEGGAMRLSLVFFRSNDVVDQRHFVATGQSAGWIDDPAHSFFTKRNERVTVPTNATRLLITLTSGGPLTTTGVMLIDDLSLAKPLPPPDLLSENFWANSTFEEGTQLDNPTAGVPTGWSRGGTFIRGNRVNAQIATSPTHALELADDKEDAYSEWYQFWNFGSAVRGGDTLEAQWFWLYQTTGDMRLSFVFFGADNAIVAQQHFIVRGESDGWTGDIATSPFVKRRERIHVPENAVRSLLTLASGGSLNVTGRLILDDLSIRVDRPRFVRIVREGNNVRLIWHGKPDVTYTVQVASEFENPTFWVPLATGLASTGEENSYVDAFSVNVPTRFYRVVQE